MELTTTLSISPQQFFHIIDQSIYADFGENITISSGITTTKKLPTILSGEATVEVTVLEYEPNVLYKASFQTPRSSNIMTYRVTPTDSDKISVHYTEETTFPRSLDRWNYKIMSVFYKKSRTKQMLQRLSAMEASILNPSADTE